MGQAGNTVGINSLCHKYVTLFCGLKVAIGSTKQMNVTVFQ